MKLGIFTALFGDWPLEKVARHDSSTDPWVPGMSPEQKVAYAVEQLKCSARAASELEVRRSGVIPTGGWMRPDRGFRFRVPGWGQVDWRRVMTALVSVGYDYVISFEHEGLVVAGRTS